MTRVLAGPFATMIFGDMGADVIKIEHPSFGDDTRSWGPPNMGSESVYFLSVNRNKRSVAIDIKHPTAVSLLHEIIGKSDVLIENFLPGKLDSLGFGYETLKELNPGLVYCSITGFGSDGPLSHRAGYDVVASAMGGLMHITGPEGGDPCKVGVAVTDICTGLFAHGAIFAALLQKQKTGFGQKIDCDLLSTQVAVLSHIAANYLNCNLEGKRRGTSHPTIVPYQAFKDKNGKFLVVGAGNNWQFKKLCKRLGRSELASDVRFENNQSRVKNSVELTSILSNELAKRTCDEWLELFDGGDFPYGPVNNMQETFSNPQVLHNNMIMEMYHPALGSTVKAPGPPVRYSSKESNSLAAAPPVLGQHTREVLCELADCSDDDVNNLIAKKIVYDQKLS